MTDWTVIVPIKPWALAKSRMGLPEGLRADIARALMLDTLETVSATGSVTRLIVVSADAEAQSIARHHGALVLSDRPLTTIDPLNQAVLLGVGWVEAHSPSSAVAVLPADLPALTPQILTAVLDAASAHDTSHLADLSGCGTTLLTALRAAHLVPRFGPDSAGRHRELGSHQLQGMDDRARSDVDTRDDLAAAVPLGLGRHTASILELV